MNLSSLFEQKHKGIADIIRNLLLNDFLGKENVQNRGVLLGKIKYYEPGMKDRRMREIYGQLLPIGWIGSHDGKRGGIYVIDKIEEIEKMIKTERKAIISRLLKLKNFKKHRKFLIEREKERQGKNIQMRLF